MNKRENKWISVKDALPEKNECVLACYHFGTKIDTTLRFVGALHYYATDEHPHFQGEGKGMSVTHWMPLPELPKV